MKCMESIIKIMLIILMVKEMIQPELKKEFIVQEIMVELIDMVEEIIMPNNIQHNMLHLEVNKLSVAMQEVDQEVQEE